VGAVPPGHVHAGYGALLAALTALCLLGGTEGSAVAVLLAGLVGAGVLVAQYRVGSRLHPTAWPLLLAGLVVLTAHNTITVVAGMSTGALHGGLWYGLTLALGYSLLVSGGLFAMAPVIRTDPGAAIDTAIVAVAAAGLLWTAIVGPARTRSGIPGDVRQLIVLVLVCAIVGVALRALVSGLTTRFAAVYLAVAAGSTLLGTVASAVHENGGSGERAGWVAASWVAASLAIAALTARPEAYEVVPGPRSAKLSPSRLVFLGAALSLFPGLATVAHLRGTGGYEVVTNAGALVVAPLVVMRIGLLARQHSSAERRLTRLATQDELTGLLNRRALVARITSLLSRVEAGDSPGVAVLFIDLDDFKVINDQYGHGVGDLFLVEVARRLRSAARSTDMAGRFGGDEFVLVLEGEPTAASAAGIAAVHAALEAPLMLAGITASGRASIGSAAARPGDHGTAEQLLSAADASMYRVKRSQREAADEPAPAGAQAEPEHADAMREH